MQCQFTPYTVYVYMYTNTNFPNETYVGVPMCSTCGTGYQFFIHYWLNSLTFMYNTHIQTQPYGGEIGTPLVVLPYNASHMCSQTPYACIYTL